MHLHACAHINMNNCENKWKALIHLSVSKDQKSKIILKMSSTCLQLVLCTSFFFLEGTQRNQLKVFFHCYLLYHNCIKLEWTSTINMLIINSPEGLHSSILPNRKPFEIVFQLYYVLTRIFKEESLPYLCEDFTCSLL